MPIPFFTTPIRCRYWTRIIIGKNDIAVVKSPLGTWRFAGELNVDLADKLVKRHIEDKDISEWLKPSGKRRVSRLSSNNQGYIVKEFAHTLRPLCLRPAGNSWVNSLYLQDLTPPCLAWLSSRQLGDFLIFQDAGTGNFWRGQYDHLDNAIELYAHCAELLAELHNRGIYHGDAKPANFVRNQWITSSARPVLIVDCDYIRQFKQVPLKYQAKNLAQFLAGTGYIRHFVRWTETLTAFIRAYQSSCSLGQHRVDAAMKQACAMINHRSVENNL
ncbi:MAG: hypothetical protein GX945_01600, partial [Lentisphaerae bacterium]|nr:hypothetical protein [Lentisphaerota bacterium]